jgi:hypothetical protein
LLCGSSDGHQGKVKPEETSAKRTKVRVLVKALGNDILYAVPEVSVTRLDAIRLEELALLCAGSIEEAKVKMILSRMTVSHR